jgi:hypothetical protein
MKETAQLLQVSPVMVHGRYHAGQFLGCKIDVYPLLRRCSVRRDLLGPTGECRGVRLDLGERPRCRPIRGSG